MIMGEIIFFLFCYQVSRNKQMVITHLQFLDHTLIVGKKVGLMLEICGSSFFLLKLCLG